MKNTTKVVLFIGIIALLGCAAYFAVQENNNASSSSPTPTGSISVSPVVTPTSSATPMATLRPRTGGFIGPTGLTKPATCALAGQIIFRQPNLFESKNVSISYQNVDDEARLINWSMSPSDALTIGPNIFVALPLPDGSSKITVALPQNPKSKSYTLRATVGYGQVIGNNVVVKTAACTGSISVQLLY